MGRLLKNPDLAPNNPAVRLPVSSSSAGYVPVDGLIRFNSSNNKVEFFYNGSWNQIAKVGKVALTVDEFTGDGSTTVFTMSLSASVDSDVTIYIGGVYQQPGVNYGVSGTVLTFTSPPPAPGINPNKIVVVHGINSTNAA